MAVVEVTIAPIGTAGPSVSSYVAACHEVLRQEQGIKYQLTPMSTVIEGDLKTIMQVILKMHEVPFTKGALRVDTAIKIDDRRDKELTMAGKIAAVERKLQEKP